MLDYEDQYRRSEEPYPGPEEFSATAAAAWSEGELHLLIDVVTPDPAFRAHNAPPLQLDNEPDDIHSDGVQVYLRPGDAGPVYGFLVVPDPAGTGIRVTGAGGTSGTSEMVRGSWQRREQGYALALTVAIPGWEPSPGGTAGLRPAGEPDGAWSHASGGAAGVERGRRVGVPPRRPSGPLEVRRAGAGMSHLAGIHLHRQQAAAGSVRLDSARLAPRA